MTMYDPFITAVNTERATLNWIDTLTQNTANLFTPGFRERRAMFADFLTGVQAMPDSYKAEQGKAVPGRSSSNMMIEGKGWFAVRKPDGKLLFTRLGDFHFDAGGTLVNELGYKLQGYMTDEKGNVLGVGPIQASNNNVANSPNNPSSKQGGTGFVGTTDVNLWLDPSNGKFFGKFDEYKVKADGTVEGKADDGKVSVPLYKIAVVNFANPQGLVEAEDNFYLPTENSGRPLEGSGEVRSGVLETSNADIRELVDYLQQAKLSLDMSNKLLTTNKSLLTTSLGLLGQ